MYLLFTTPKKQIVNDNSALKTSLSLVKHYSLNKDKERYRHQSLLKFNKLFCCKFNITKNLSLDLSFS